MLRPLLLALILSWPSLAQPMPTPAPPPPPLVVAEPTDVGVLCRRLASGTFQPLEFCDAVRSSEFSIFLNGQVFYRIPGQKSPVRFKPGEPIEFYLRSFLDSSDPRAAFFPIRDPQKFSLYDTEEDDDNRRVPLEDDHFLSRSSVAGRPLNVRLSGNSSFLLCPSTPLAPGEYAIHYPLETGKARLFCFGVDAKPDN